jgi:hypothetical protein
VRGDNVITDLKGTHILSQSGTFIFCLFCDSQALVSDLHQGI